MHRLTKINYRVLEPSLCPDIFTRVLISSPFAFASIPPILPLLCSVLQEADTCKLHFLGSLPTDFHLGSAYLSLGLQVGKILGQKEGGRQKACPPTLCFGQCLQ